jgi:DNA mismatch endonuclease (patch repair protein)
MKAGDPKYPHPTSPQVSAVMRANRKMGSRPEVELRSLLHRSGLRFRKNLRVVLPALSVTPDIVFPGRKVAVFIDGCFWHSCPVHATRPRQNRAYWESKLARNLSRDARVNLALQEAGWRVVRLWEHEAPEIAVTAVFAAVRSSPRRRS